jgi:urea carboxylase
MSPFPPRRRVDQLGRKRATEVSPFYDPMLAKIIVTGADRRAGAIARLRTALAATRVYGIETNLDYLSAIAASDMLAQGRVATRALAEFPYRPHTVEVLAPGAQSSLQDWPGRLGYWDVGVPPSGPMDALAHRLANRLVGNPAEAAALEITLSGPTLRFNVAALIALAGADMGATLDGVPVPLYEAVAVAAGQVLAMGTARGGGNRATLAVRHGFDAPLYLGSRATFALGRFGGHASGCLRTGDVLRLNRAGARGRAPDAWRQRRGRNWATTGPSACWWAPMARPTSLPPRTWPPSLRRTIRSISTAPAPACA